MRESPILLNKSLREFFLVRESKGEEFLLKDKLVVSILVDLSLLYSSQTLSINRIPYSGLVRMLLLVDNLKNRLYNLILIV